MELSSLRTEHEQACPLGRLLASPLFHIVLTRFIAVVVGDDCAYAEGYYTMMTTKTTLENHKEKEWRSCGTGFGFFSVIFLLRRKSNGMRWDERSYGSMPASKFASSAKPRRERMTHERTRDAKIEGLWNEHGSNEITTNVPGRR